MKKLLILPVILACSVSFAQNLPDTKTINKQKANYIKASTKILKYEISVKQ